MQDWDDYVGAGRNEKYCIGIQAWRNGIALFDYPAGDSWRQLDYESDKSFATSDIFGISFNFIENSVSLSLNYNLIETVSLNGFKSIVPAFSLGGENDSFHIIKYVFK